jgi:localization factor PodJL
MNKTVPWSIKGVDFDTREAAKDAARRDGVTLGEWLNRAISDRAAEMDANPRDFDADERLEAVAAQLALISRETDATPQRRRGEAGRRREERSAEQRWRGESSWDEDLTAERAPRPAARESLRAKPEALLEQAMAAFEVQAGRVEAGAARAFANAATLIEKTESERFDRLSRLHDRLADIEVQMQTKESPSDARFSRRPPAPVHDPLPGVASDEQFSSLERRLKALMERLERPNPRGAAPASARHLDDAPQAGLLESLRREFPAAAIHELADRVEDAMADSLTDALVDSLAESSMAFSAAPAELEKLRGELAAMGRTLADVAPRGAVAGVESAVRELANRVESTRDALLRAAEARGETASSAEIEALARQVAAMGQALENVAPRSQLASLESSLRVLGENLERSRNDGLREAVLAPIESLARDLRGELAEVLAEVLPEAFANPGASTDFDVVATQLRQIESKLEDLLRAGWADREDFLKVQDKSDELRATIAAAAEHFAPIARIEQQVAALSDRLEEMAHRAGEASRAQEAGLKAGLAQSAVHWRGVETRLDDLAARTPPTLEPLLRALAEKLDLAAAPQPDSGVLEALERQMAQVADRLSEQVTEKLAEKQESRDPPWGARLERAIEDLVSRFELSRQNEYAAAREALREALSGLPEIAGLREERKASDFRSQQTLATVHETLEKVVDRLATLEEDVIEVRAGQGERAPRKSEPMASSPFYPDSFLVEPGGGRPDARRAAESGPAQASQQANYIDVARRAIAARAAAEQADKPEAEPRKRAKTDEADAFVWPMTAGVRRRLPALLATASAVLVLGAWQAWRFFDMTPQPHIASAVTSAVEPGGDRRPSAAKSPSGAAPAAQSATATPAHAPNADASATALPGGLVPATGAALETGTGAGPGVDPLAVGSIKPREIQMALLKQMADKGDAAAQFDMGARLMEGRGLTRDPAAAIGWFEKAAAQGLAQAQFRLGAGYEKGLGVTRDAAKARECYEKAAALGHVRAMHNLAVMLAEGVEGKPDYATAAQWFRRAADYGLRDSQYNLAILYARGLGVTQDLGQSYAWFDIAARQGDEDAAKKRDDVGARLDAPTYAAARKQSDDFHARTPAAAINDPPSLPTGPAAALVFSPSSIAKTFSRM